MSEERLTCPRCGEPVTKEDNFCRTCGGELMQPQPLPIAPSSTTMPPIPPEMPPPAPPPPPYQRKYGLISRLLGVLFKPFETMEDVALAPDYVGVIIIFIFETILAIISVSIVLSKIEFTGTYANLFRNVMQAALVFSSAASFILIPVKWLIKSLIVWKVSDAGSGWKFKSAASVTGYAYIANLIASLVTVPLYPFIIPNIHIDTSDLEFTRTMLDTYRAQLTPPLYYAVLPSFIALLWKSYLGAIGTHHGTKEMFTVSNAFLLFFLLGAISVILSLFGTY